MTEPERRGKASAINEYISAAGTQPDVLVLMSGDHKDPLDPGRWQQYCALLDLRCAGQPVSYIRRKKEFFSLEYYVDSRVLVPRCMMVTPASLHICMYGSGFLAEVSMIFTPSSMAAAIKAP